MYENNISPLSPADRFRLANLVLFPYLASAHGIKHRRGPLLEKIVLSRITAQYELFSFVCCLMKKKLVYPLCRRI